MLKELKGFCFICKERMMLMCGTPKVVVGGCCVYVEYKDIKWMTDINAHYPCYVGWCKLPEKEQNKIKRRYTEKDMKKILIPEFKARIKHRKILLKEDFCKGEYADDIKNEIVKYKRWLRRLQ